MAPLWPQALPRLSAVLRAAVARGSQGQPLQLLPVMLPAAPAVGDAARRWCAAGSLSVAALCWQSLAHEARLAWLPWLKCVCSDAWLAHGERTT
jgi:hypothetical protein